MTTTIEEDTAKPLRRQDGEVTNNYHLPSIDCPTDQLTVQQALISELEKESESEDGEEC